ncbi:hypothetical protein AMECASPLE_033317 [Ameca splendens]|uniref:Uncharacterized protein n=1 Tax=Ameca splendens TaxID=208324 RepID=A0ABV0ZHH0_9TELE
MFKLGCALQRSEQTQESRRAAVFENAFQNGVFLTTLWCVRVDRGNRDFKYNNVACLLRVCPLSLFAQETTAAVDLSQVVPTLLMLNCEPANKKFMTLKERRSCLIFLALL